MRGVILAGGKGTRLAPMTYATNKHLIPVGDRPMIFYPIRTLKNAGIRNIMIVTGGEHLEQIARVITETKASTDAMLESHRALLRGLEFTFRVQDEAGGIAQALSLCEDFVHGDSVMVILGDNIITGDLDTSFYTGGAKIFLKDVPDPERFGVAELLSNEERVVINAGDVEEISEHEGLPTTPSKENATFLKRSLSIKQIIEKPTSSMVGDIIYSTKIRPHAVIGLYIYDFQVFDIIRTLKPSGRGELEITDVNNAYLAKNELYFSFVPGDWSDAGTVESLERANQIIR
jgi:glucose-1-phosphate thymidylyltransferase